MNTNNQITQEDIKNNPRFTNYGFQEGWNYAIEYLIDKFYRKQEHITTIVKSRKIETKHEAMDEFGEIYICIDYLNITDVIVNNYIFSFINLDNTLDVIRMIPVLPDEIHINNDTKYQLKKEEADPKPAKIKNDPEEYTFMDIMDWAESAFHMGENTLYDEYDNNDYTQINYDKEEAYIYMNNL